MVGALISNLLPVPMLRLLAALLVILPTGCATVSPYENYTNWMQAQVGRWAYDPDTYRRRYVELRVAERQLANGNIEEEFRRGRGGKCPTYFEIDPKTEKIVAWRHEGQKEDCGIRP
jgi:hypothetical protein